MTLIAVTQRVAVDPRTGERRDALDQRWAELLHACGLTPLVVPNHPATARRLLDALPVRGVLLTGGNDLGAYGGDAPERDATETWLLAEALRTGRPVLGVCRGMQVVQQHYGVPLERVAGHVGGRLMIEFDGQACDVNSYHCWGALTTSPGLDVVARAADGVIKAVRHRAERVLGIMWHPEREESFAPRDVELLRRWFGETSA